MLDLLPCTVQVLTKNSVQSLASCLDTLKDFAEVIVQDGYSTDGTRELLTKYPNVRVLDQDRRFLNAKGAITDFASMRNESIKTARFDWILVVDADEGILPELATEVREILSEKRSGVYQTFRRFFVNGERIDYSSGYPALQIRFFHRSLTEGYTKKIHERLVLKQGVRLQMLRTELPVPLPPASELQAKFDRYFWLEVQRLGVLPYGRWFVWIFLRNLRSVIGLSIRLLWIWLLPRIGKRMPLEYEFQYMRHSLRLIVATFPPIAKKSLRLREAH